MKQESPLPSISAKLGKKVLLDMFAGSVEPDFKVELVESFSFKQGAQLIQKVATKEKQFIAIEEVPYQFYYILHTNGREVYQWGIRPVNHFFGLRQALHINFFDNVVAKENLLICENVVDTLALLHIGVPAINVDPDTVWKNPYFNQIIRKTFSNLIVTYDKKKVPKGLLNRDEVKLFDLSELLKAQQIVDNIRDYCWNYYKDDDFLEGLWEHYKYINDDRLLFENNDSQFSLLH